MAQPFEGLDCAGALELIPRSIGGRRVLIAPGDVDIATAAALRAGLRRLVESGAPEVWLDLSQVGFLDSAGLRILLDSRSGTFVA
jgi:anti-anti-sigma factor